MSILNIAKHEFVNLISNRYIYVILLFYLVNIIFKILYINDAYQSGTESWMIVNGALWELVNLLSLYGGIVVLLIGFSSMNDEYRGNALNTLLTKPVYRDTIINGKLTGCMLFILCLFGLTIMMFLSALIALCGNAIITSLPVILIRLPLIVLFALLCAMIYFAFAVLLRILIRNAISALLMIITVFTIIDVTHHSVFSGQIASLTGMSDAGTMALIAGFTPWWSTMMVTNGGLFSVEAGTAGLVQAIGNCWPEFMKLAVIVAILIVSGYIAFIRRDAA